MKNDRQHETDTIPTTEVSTQGASKYKSFLIGLLLMTPGMLLAQDQNAQAVEKDFLKQTWSWIKKNIDPKIWGRALPFVGYTEDLAFGSSVELASIGRTVGNESKSQFRLGGGISPHVKWKDKERIPGSGSSVHISWIVLDTGTELRLVLGSSAGNTFRGAGLRTDF